MDTTDKPSETSVPLQTLNSGTAPPPPGQYAYNQPPQQQFIIAPPRVYRIGGNRKTILIIMGVYCGCFILSVIIFSIVFFTVFNKALSEYDKVSQDINRARQEQEKHRFGNW